jgi:hypothetical protein
MSFCGYLRGNTAATIKLGPFLDSTDGNTDETALTLSQADIRLSKNGGDYAQKNDANAATHDEIGIYDCAINTTDTNTYGRLRVTVHESGALTVDQTYMVLPEIVYDSLYPAAAGNPLPLFGILDWGTAQASAAGTLVHRSGLNLANDIPNGATEFVYSGTGAGQARTVHDFTNATDTADVSPNWTTTPSTDSLYATFATPPGSTSALPTVDVTKWNGTAVATPATAGYPAVTVKVGTGTGEVNLASGKAPATIAAGDIAANALTASAAAADLGVELAAAVLAAADTTPISARARGVTTDEGDFNFTGDGTALNKIGVEAAV